MNRYSRQLCAAFAAGFLFAGCATTREPPNLGLLKRQIRAYVESGDYERDIAAVARRAGGWIEKRVAQGGTNLVVVFDLDETLLRNWPHMAALDFGYVPVEWSRWVENAEAPAISAVQEVYRRARALGVGVVFITGRRETERAATERNLQAIGCGDYLSLRCRPDGDERTTAEYKTSSREQVASEGRVIIANLGDQESDLVGGYAERTFKLPNPIYVIE